MKKLIIVSITLLGLCSASFAQESKRPKQKQEEQIIKLKKEIQLKEKQLKEKQSANAVLLSAPRPEVNAIKQN